MWAPQHREGAMCPMHHAGRKPQEGAQDWVPTKLHWKILVKGDQCAQTCVQRVHTKSEGFPLNLMLKFKIKQVTI